MQDKMTVYKRLEESLTDMVTEEQAKLGYRKETIRLYYPLESLNHLFACEAPVEDMQKMLADFPNCTTHGFEIAEISHKGDRFCFQLAPAASEYVYRNREKNIFIYDLVKLLQQNGTTLQNMIDFSENGMRHVLLKKSKMRTLMSSFDSWSVKILIITVLKMKAATSSITVLCRRIIWLCFHDDTSIQ